MKVFNKAQIIFIVLIMLALTAFLASVIFYQQYGYKPTRIVKVWRFMAVFEGLFYSNVPKAIRIHAITAFGYGFLISLLVPIFGLIKINMDNPHKLFGDAKFQSLSDIKKCKSISYGNESGSKGFIIGSFKAKLIRYIMPDFVSLSAGTRSGKGAAVVIPNLLEWSGSIVVNDIKQECFKITSRYRQKVLGNKVYLIDPFSENSHGFNPLYYVDLSTNEGSSDLMGIAEIIYPTDLVTGAEKHFNEQGQNLFIGYTKALYILIKYRKSFLNENDVEPIFSIGVMLDLYFRAELEELITTLLELLEDDLDEVTTNLIFDAKDKLAALMAQEGETRGSIVGTFEKQLKLFRLPLFKVATNKNDVDFRQLRREKITIYLGILPDNVKIAALFLNLFWNTLIKVQLSENPDFVPDLKYNLAGILDEFPASGKIPYIKDAAGYIAGYKLQLLTISQNYSQLRELYGADGTKSLMANHSCKIVYAVSENDDAVLYSKELGTVTDKSKNRSKSKGKGGVSTSDSVNDARRELKLPQELKTLPDNKEIILLKGVDPIYCDKAYYFNSRYFMDKLISISPTLQKIQASIGKNKFPSKDDLALALSRQELEIKI